MHRVLRPCVLAAVLATALAALATPAAAQLRPLPPADWQQDRHAATCGVGHYQDLGVGLVGARGSLTSLGDCTVMVNLGRARIHAAGVIRRTFTEDSRFAAPAPGVDPDAGPTRSDWGDLVVETLVPFAPDGGPWIVGLRFGARWPTTDNTVGLERDKTDIHAAAMGGYRSGPFFGYLELGAGINGARLSHIEQQDVLIYTTRVSYDLSVARVHLTALGHFRPSQRYQRGNETLGEVRAGVRLGDASWTAIELIAGYTDLSPAWGLRIRVGRAFGR